MCHKQGSGILHKVFVIHFCIDLLHVTMKGAKKRRNSIIDVCARFPIWKSIKEASKLWPNELGLFNFLKVLKIPKVLLTKSTCLKFEEKMTEKIMPVVVHISKLVVQFLTILTAVLLE